MSTQAYSDALVTLSAGTDLGGRTPTTVGGGFTCIWSNISAMAGGGNAIATSSGTIRPGATNVEKEAYYEVEHGFQNTKGSSRIPGAHDMVCTAKGIDVTFPMEVRDSWPIRSATWRGLRTWARKPAKSARNFTRA
jgi:hypothetical protein